MTRIIQAAQAENFYEPLPKFPFVTRDLSMRVGDRTRVADVESTIYAVAGDILKDIDLFDLYDDPETQERSFAFHLIFGSDDRTLTSDEVDALIVRVISTLEEDPVIEVRSK